MKLGEKDQVLQISTSLFKRIMNFIPTLFFVKGIGNLRYLFANKAYCAFVGRSIDDLIGKSDREVLPEGLAEQCEKSDKQALVSEISSVEECFGGKSFQVIKFVVEDYLIGLIWENTEANQTRKMFEHAQAMLQAFSEQIFVGFLELDSDGKLLFANKAFLDLLGYEKEDVERGVYPLDSQQNPIEGVIPSILSGQGAVGISCLLKTKNHRSIRQTIQLLPWLCEGELVSLIGTTLPAQNQTP